MKFFTKEVTIGLTGVVALIILYLGINFLKGMKFGANQDYYITFKNAKGLATSSAVFADGYQIGIVNDIQYNYDKPGTVIVKITVDDDVRIPAGTTASLSEGMLGGCTLNMTMGTNPKVHLEPGDTIVGSDNTGLMDQVASVMPQVNLVLQHVDSLITTLNLVASDPNIRQTLQNAESLTAKLDGTAEKLDGLMKNDVPQLLGTLNKVSTNAETITANFAQIDLKNTVNQVNKTIDDVQGLIDMMQDPNGNLGLLLKDTAVYHRLNETVGSANNLLIDLKENPGRYVHFSMFGKKEKK